MCLQVSQFRSSRTRVTAELSYVRVPRTPVTYVRSSDLLADGRIQVEGEPGLPDCCRYLRSESEVSALGFGTYCFTESVYEITLRPRPASPVSTHIVETDHPRIHFSMSFHVPADLSDSPARGHIRLRPHRPHRQLVMGPRIPSPNHRASRAPDPTTPRPRLREQARRTASPHGPR